ncbi:hypothetical protein P4C99_04360 [Pontiellaceae bacterium B1224]|nr:hypothetical protein [Pontiellaceae bacterium B1224]
MININRLLNEDGESPKFITTQKALKQFSEFSESDLGRWALDLYLTVKYDDDGNPLWNVGELYSMANRVMPAVSSSWITTAQVEEKFGIGLGVLKRLARNKIVTPRRIGKGQWFWNLKQLQDFANEIPEVSEVL